jgi:hypothetical protein
MEPKIMTRGLAWVPLLTLPALACALTPESWPPWVFMWLLCFALFIGCKWLTWQTATVRGAPWPRQLGYLCAWPGLDAQAFLASPLQPRRTRQPLLSWLFALGKLLLGILLLGVLFPAISPSHELLRGWVGMLGIIFVLHFGLFHLLSLSWQRLGVDAKPVMNWPILSRSVSEFWGQRWNTAFRDLTHRFLFRPLTAWFGGRTAIGLGFLFSGLVHELVISIPARGGFGGPTAFFVIQAAALLVERSAPGQRLGLARGGRGWTFTMLVLLVPIPLLFHAPFVRRIVVPFLDWLVQMTGVSHA